MPGSGSNLNVPLPPGARDDEWLRAVAELVQAARSSGAEALVLALGVDAAGGDPESPLDVTVRGFREAGRLIGQHGLPVVVVQEGGYDLASIGGLVLATLGRTSGRPWECLNRSTCGSARTRSRASRHSRGRT